MTAIDTKRIEADLRDGTGAVRIPGMGNLEIVTGIIIEGCPVVRHKQKYNGITITTPYKLDMQASALLPIPDAQVKAERDKKKDNTEVMCSGCKTYKNPNTNEFDRQYNPMNGATKSFNVSHGYCIPCYDTAMTEMDRQDEEEARIIITPTKRQNN